MFECSICTDKGIRGHSLSFSHNGVDYFVCKCPNCSHMFYVDTLEYDFKGRDSQNHTTRIYIEKTADIETLINIMSNFLTTYTDLKCGLEIGCGFGVGMDFANAFHKVEMTGFEPAEYFFDNAGKYLGLNVHIDYFNVDSVGNKKFDFVTCLQVIQLVSDPTKMLKGVRSVLKQNGLCLFSTPDNSLLTGNETYREHLSVLSPGVHRQIFSIKSLYKLFESAGFQNMTHWVHDGNIYVLAGDAPIRELNLFEPQRAVCTEYYEKALINIPQESPLYKGLWYRLFRSRIDNAEYDEAYRLLQEAIWFEVWTPEEIGAISSLDKLFELNTAADSIIYYYTGILFLNKFDRPAYAERFFELSYLLCEKIILVQPEMSLVERDIIWLAKLHQILAMYYQGKWELGNLELQIFLSPRAHESSFLPNPSQNVLEKAKDVYKKYYHRN